MSLIPGALRRFPLADAVADRLHGSYSYNITPLLPCGHGSVTWYGWKLGAVAGHDEHGREMREHVLSLSLESHVMLRCSQCGAVVPLGPTP